MSFEFGSDSFAKAIRAGSMPAMGAGMPEPDALHSALAANRQGPPWLGFAIAVPLGLTFWLGIYGLAQALI